MAIEWLSEGCLMNYMKYILWSQSSSQWTVLQTPTFLAVLWERPWKSVTLLSIGVAPPDQSKVLLFGQRGTHWSCPADKELTALGNPIKHFSGAEKSHTKCLRRELRMNQFLINRKENLGPKCVERPYLTARGLCWVLSKSGHLGARCYLEKAWRWEDTEVGEFLETRRLENL